jgi:hypothetical protein
MNLEHNALATVAASWGVDLQRSLCHMFSLPQHSPVDTVSTNEVSKINVKQLELHSPYINNYMFLARCPQHEGTLWVGCVYSFIHVAYGEPVGKLIKFSTNVTSLKASPYSYLLISYNL